MNWEAIGAIGEIVGALAVVATLLYLAKETHTNTKAVIAASTRASNLGYAEFDERLATNPELIPLLLKSLHTTMPEYNEIEWARFQYFARSLVGRCQDDFLQLRLGLGDSDLVEAHLNFLRSILKYPAWSTYWEDDKSIWVADFVENIESRKEGHIGQSSLQDIQSRSGEAKLGDINT